MSGSFKAIDRNASLGPRTHSFLAPDGSVENYVFKPGQWLDLPRRIALKLASIEGFDVVDANGNAFKFKPAGPRLLSSLQIAPDETVARYDELSDEALIARAAKIAPGKIPEDRDECIILLMGAPVVAPKSDDGPLEVVLDDAAA